MYTQFRYGLEKRVVDLYLKAAIGAAGAPTISKPDSKGILSIARTGTGAYTVTLEDKYVGLLLADYRLVLAAGAPTGMMMVIRSVAVNAATPTVAIQFVDEAGAAEEIASGSTLLLKLELKASGV
jgi:hypothetical protein